MVWKYSDWVLEQDELLGVQVGKSRSEMSVHNGYSQFILSFVNQATGRVVTGRASIVKMVELMQMGHR